MQNVYSLITKELHNGFETEEYAKGKNDKDGFRFWDKLSSRWLKDGLQTPSM